jgi:hypothetical protein
VLGDGIRLFSGPLRQSITLPTVSLGQSGELIDIRFNVNAHQLA